MPAEPSPSLLKKFTGPSTSGPKRKPEELSPSILRDLFEGIVDTGLGAIGVGPDSTMNRAGAVLSAGLPFAGLKNGLSQIGKMPGRTMLENSAETILPSLKKGPSITQIQPSAPVPQLGPTSSEVDRLIAQMKGRMTNIPSRGHYTDDANFLTGSKKGPIPTNRGIAGPSNEQKLLTRGDADYAFYQPDYDDKMNEIPGFHMYNIPVDGGMGKTTVSAETVKKAGYGIPHSKVGPKKPAFNR